MHFVVFDIETKNIFSDVGANDPTLLDISVVGLYDSRSDKYLTFTEDEFHKMWPIFENADFIVGFNSEHFDLPLLNKYYSGDLNKIKHIDLMKEVRNVLGRRIKLDTLADAILGKKKSGDGLDAVRWYEEGKMDLIKEYCIKDVEITKEIYEFIKNNKKIYYFERDSKDVKKELRIDTTNWDKKVDNLMTFSLPF